MELSYAVHVIDNPKEKPRVHHGRLALTAALSVRGQELLRRRGFFLRSFRFREVYYYYHTTCDTSNHRVPPE